MDDRRLGAILRALRRRAGLRQADLALMVGCHQTTISRAERGHLEHLSHGLLKRTFAALGARFEGEVRWRGGEIDRLIDARHSALVEQVSALVLGWGWRAVPEATFSIYGERGSIDLLAGHAGSRTATVFEMKTDLYSIEDTVRRHDVKARHVAAIVLERFGWRPERVARVLVVAESTPAREAIARHRATFASVYPLRGRQVREWLQRPNGVGDGVWLLRLKHGEIGKRRGGGSGRVRRVGHRTA